MGFTYVHVDSAKQRTKQHHRSEIEVNLLNPIQNCVGMRLLNFSIGNEFFNAIDGNDSVTILFFKQSTTPSDDVASMTLVLPHRFYTHVELVTELNKQVAIAGRSFRAYTYNSTYGFYQTAVVPSVTIAMEIEFSTNTSALTQALDGSIDTDNVGEYTKIRVQADSASVAYNRAILFHANNLTFQSSILHRLGFQRTQVMTFNTDDKRSDESIMAFLTATKPLAAFGGGSTGTFFSTRTQGALTIRQSIDWTDHNQFQTITQRDEGTAYLVFTPTASSILNSGEYPHYKLSSHKCFETLESVNVDCDLINDSQILQFGQKQTQLTQILAKINVDVSHGSWINWSGQSEEYYHSLEGQSIKKFNLFLNHGKTYERILTTESREWTATVVFETRDQIVDNNIRQLEALEQSQFVKKFT